MLATPPPSLAASARNVSAGSPASSRRATASLMTASMLRDIERGAPTEADQILGALLRRADAAADAPVLQAAYVHVKAYEARRVRETAAAA